MKLLSHIIPIFLFLSLFSGKNYAQINNNMLQAHASLDTMLVLIGDHFTLQIDVDWEDSTFVQFPVFTDTVIKNIEILKDLPFDTISNAENKMIRKKYILTSFDSGYYHIPPIPITLRPKTGDAQEIFTEPLFIFVQTMQIDSTANTIADIKKTLDTPLTLKEFIQQYLPYFLIIVAAIILTLAILWLIRRQRNRPVEHEIIIPKEEAHVVALRELDNLNSQKIWQSGFVKQYYSELSDIMRTYLEQRFEMPAMESSTSDITLLLKNQKTIDKELKQKLLEFLEIADLVKFAKFDPVASEHLKYMEHSYAFVLQTKIEEIISDAESNTTTQNNS